MKVWIVQTGEPLHCDGCAVRPMRAMNLADTLVARGHDVTIWSSDFNHQAKRHRSGKFTTIIQEERLKINLVPSPGYERNIGFSRLFDHAVLAYRLWRLMRSQLFAEPDVVFVGYPPIEVAWVVTKWCFSKKIPTVIDVKDQWPSLFLEAAPRRLRPLVKAALFPYFRAGVSSMRTASVWSSMSKGYMGWIAEFAGRPESSADIISPLTVRVPSIKDGELSLARKWWSERGVDLSKRNKFIFVGSFMSVFNFEAIKRAADVLNDEGVDCQFVICGSGGSEREIRRMMEGSPNVFLPGWVDLPQIVALATSAVAAIIPYKNIENFTLNIPNKVVDALALGLPILSTLGGEVGELVRSNEVGFCEADASGERLARAMEQMLLSPELTRQSGERARRLYVDRFAFDRVYGLLADKIEMLGSQS